ncbi:LysR family transcriptional regulator [Alicyclobacillus acidoterrestris]|uniref:LysR family transcriptional regulator n=1 Tax=Alicyclobacillus acidoterrestris (strain ATCC 49025 / DSM 3922 / CIP 106132 / NCIMB 13137 / GD3B) TaxID=1356854 RepID=T0CZA2_ALIAG|nr:LysR family transcriptional regulator [Alicyclobacillus acidoterrestris]EPZ42901.1 hypothetical protein N007_13945 [Alicyclobacillus acidoterrestris ATCC 49025]UNO50080.1 LysR family transcriptional regulator [Alicyclobacillus acidoterrestris]
MDEKDCRILQCLWQEKNLTRAADRLYITQPALTYRLRRLEQEFGAAVMFRNGKGIGFTPEGEYLVHYAQKMLSELQQTKDKIANMSHEVQGNLRVGVSSYFGLHNLPKILRGYHADFPKVHINVTTGWSEEIYELLIHDDIHVGVVRGDFHWPEAKYLLSEERICIISKSEIHLDDLPSLPQISYKAPVLANNLASYAHSSLAQMIDDWWYERFHVPPHISMQVDSFETCKEMVKNVFGYAIVPSNFVHRRDGLKHIDLVRKDGVMVKRGTWMFYREAALQYTMVDKFIDFMKNFSNEAADSEW